MASLIVKKLMKLSAGATVELVYDEGGDNQKLVGTVSDNDGEENLELILENGEEQIVSYSLVRRVKVTAAGAVPEKKEIPEQKTEKKSVEVPKMRELMQNRTPRDLMNRNDHELKSLYDRLPSSDKKLLSGVYDSFKHGIRVNDRSKMAAAANQARQILFQEDDRGYYWSDEAVDFCASLLRRNFVYDSDVCLIANRFYEAAFSSAKNQDYNMAGVFAITGLLEKEPYEIESVFAILADAIVQTGDISGLKVLLRYLPEKLEPMAWELMGDLFAAKGIKVSAERNRETEL